MRASLAEFLLAAMPATVSEWAEDAGYTPATVRALVRALRSAKPKLCFVLRWARGRNGFTPVYMAGCLKDRPKPITKSPRNPRRPTAQGPFAQLFI